MYLIFTGSARVIAFLAHYVTLTAGITLTVTVAGKPAGKALLCSCFIHLSYQDGYQLVTVSTNGDFIVLPHWETRL